jgi:hypothetical protein
VRQRCFIVWAELYVLFLGGCSYAGIAAVCCGQQHLLATHHTCSWQYACIPCAVVYMLARAVERNATAGLSCSA